MTIEEQDTQVHPDKRRRSRRELALNVGAIAGTICIVATVLSLMFGVKPLVFRSGSMSPAITTGSLALAQSVSADKVKVGDVVSVMNPQGTRITHRVFRIQHIDGQTLLTLKGDANAQPDLLPYPVTKVDRVFAHVGFLGYLVAWLSSGIAIFLGGLLAGALLMLAFGPMRRPGDKPSDNQITQSDNDIQPAFATSPVNANVVTEDAADPVEEPQRA
ncbi:signal peptidase I [Jongsikchunia kroppenstedtii]|uniref:signal peptidase I n=1 Tax=Jongsikchunia kroppenstedtii TaxID=1121721 RepID=UPI00038053D7|nr:signal peptidase I [Jongsikchunia kroppenstedtii]